MMFHNGSVASMWMGRLSLSLRWAEGGSALCTSIPSVQFPSLEIIKNGPRAGQLMVIVFVS